MSMKQGGKTEDGEREKAMSPRLRVTLPASFGLNVTCSLELSPREAQLSLFKVKLLRFKGFGMVTSVSQLV